MTDIEWPEGATHRITGTWIGACGTWFCKWVDGIGYLYEGGSWNKDPKNMSLKSYLSTVGYAVIERPKEPEATEPVINWDEQPTPEHVWLEELSHVHDESGSGWYKQEGEGWHCLELGIDYKKSFEGKSFRIHRKPATEPYKPEVGDTIEALMTDKWVEAKVYGVGEFGGCLAKPEGHWYDEFTSDRIRPIKSEREQIIERAIDLCVGCLGNKYESIVETISGVLYDNGLLRIPDE